MATRKSTRSKPAASKSAASRQAASKLAPPKPTVPKAAPAPAEAAPIKRKQKLIRDSFTIPKNEYLVLDELKQRALRAGRVARKSEILRAGITVLNTMSDSALLAALSVVPSLKTGRPKADKGKEASKPSKKE